MIDEVAKLRDHKKLVIKENDKLFYLHGVENNIFAFQLIIRKIFFHALLAILSFFSLKSMSFSGYAV